MISRSLMGPLALCLGIVAVTCGVLMYRYAPQVDAFSDRLFYGKGGPPVTQRRELRPWRFPGQRPAVLPLEWGRGRRLGLHDDRVQPRCHCDCPLIYRAEWPDI